ncbi:TPA: DUF4127 family protein [Clostridioides difficile]|nr:DUF4127 family protein [Clostridioides difficile]
MKILYVPLDERPCNIKFPSLITASRKDVELIIPPKSLLPKKKKPADIGGLWEFVLEQSKNCQYAVISLDMLLYGGLLPSRIHTETKEVVYKRIEKLKQLRKLYPQLVIYAFQCIMRCPHYDSNEEEPDYYGQYGENLFTRAWLLNKKERIGINEEEENKLQSIKIPPEYIQDYENRCKFNLSYNLHVAELVKDKFIDTLVIPQDDSSEFGYTSIAQKKVVSFINKEKLERHIYVYPGADEVGSSLIAKAWNHYNNRTLKVYPFFSSTMGKYITPLYEDRPIMESLKHHVRVIHGELVEDEKEADIILAYNTCGKIMQESFNQLESQDLTYTSHRNLMDFVQHIESYVNCGMKVALCDSAFSNGSDLTLLRYLDEHGLMDKLYGYAGWNTNCNSLGTVLSMATFSLDSISKETLYHLAYRYIEDGIYQAYVRQIIVNDVLPTMGLSYYDFKDKQKYVEQEIRKRCQQYFESFEFFNKYKFKIENIYMPWKRMFEIGIELK